MANIIILNGTSFLDSIIVNGVAYETAYDAIDAGVVTEDEVLDLIDEEEEFYAEYGFCVVDGYLCTSPWDIQKKV